MNNEADKELARFYPAQSFEMTAEKRLSGAQRRKDTRTRIKRDGVWRPHARVKRGKERGSNAENS